MLKKFQDIVAEVEAQEEKLQEEYDEIEAMQNDLIEKQDPLRRLLMKRIPRSARCLRILRN